MLCLILSAMLCLSTSQTELFRHYKCFGGVHLLLQAFHHLAAYHQRPKPMISSIPQSILLTCSRSDDRLMMIIQAGAACAEGIPTSCVHPVTSLLLTLSMTG